MAVIPVNRGDDVNRAVKLVIYVNTAVIPVHRGDLCE